MYSQKYSGSFSPDRVRLSQRSCWAAVTDSHGPAHVKSEHTRQQQNFQNQVEVELPSMWDSGYEDMHSRTGAGVLWCLSKRRF